MRSFKQRFAVVAVLVGYRYGVVAPGASHLDSKSSCEATLSPVIESIVDIVFSGSRRCGRAEEFFWPGWEPLRWPSRLVRSTLSAVWPTGWHGSARQSL